MQFSRNKLLSLEKQQQIRKLIDFIKEIDTIHDDSKKYKEVMNEFLKVIYYLQSANSDLIIHFNFPQNIMKHIKTKKFHLILEQTSYREFLKYVLPFVHKFGRAQTDADFLSSLPDGIERPEKNFLPIYLILHNLRSAFNVGSIMRTAECMGVEKIFFTGYTPTPTNSGVKKTAMGTEKHINWEKANDIEHLITELRNKKIKVYALETSPKAEPLKEVEWQENTAILLGNEALGITKDLLQTVDKIVSIPLRGWKNSLNVSVATAICLYEIQKHFSRKNNLL